MGERRDTLKTPNLMTYFITVDLFSFLLRYFIEIAYFKSLTVNRDFLANFSIFAL